MEYAQGEFQRGHQEERKEKQNNAEDQLSAFIHETFPIERPNGDPENPAIYSSQYNQSSNPFQVKSVD
jgi:hypothetical protein